MRISRPLLLKLLGAALLIGGLVLVVGCGGPQNTFAPEGEVAEKQRDILLLSLWPTIVVFVMVEAVIVFVLIRFRRRREDEPNPKQVHGNIRLELTWTILPFLLLVAIAVPVVNGIFDVGRAPSEDALEVRVTAFRFDWEFEYPEFATADGTPLKVGRTGTEAPELHIPVGRDIGIFLESLDVIHSFWVPKLGGKLDVVPGRTNVLVLSAEAPGTFSAQCAEFCGTGHAGMRFNVVAHTEEEFQAWVDEQLATSSAATANED